jgi:hypothetical protein
MYYARFLGGVLVLSSILSPEGVSVDIFHLQYIVQVITRNNIGLHLLFLDITNFTPVLDAHALHARYMHY